MKIPIKCKFDIVSASSGFLVLRDRDERGHMSVTNDAEALVEYLFQAGQLHYDQRLLYYDSEGNLDEIIIEDEHFAGFKPYRKDLA